MLELKGIILHGGHGTRLRPLTHTGPKQLLPIANKPMSQYALEDLKNSGIIDIGIIIGGVYSEKVKEYYGTGEKFGVNITYIKQDSPKGISHAISLCKNFIGNDKFIVYLGDNVLRKDLVDYTKKFQSSDSDAMILLCKVKDAKRFGIAVLDKENPNKINQIIEKPKNPLSDLAVIGIYFLTPKIFNIINKLKPSWRGELEITDALQLLMDQKNKIEYDIVTGWWKDTGTPEDIIDANKLVLDSFDITNNEKNSKYPKNILIGKNCKISENSILKGPIIMGDNCVVSSATIGPNVSIGDNSILENCGIENSILMNDCKIISTTHIFDSIIANGSEIKKSTLDKKQQFLLGERSQVNL